MKLFSRWLAFALVVVILSLLAIGTWFYRYQEYHMRQEIEADLETIAQFKVRQIVDWRSERLSDIAVHLENPFTVAALVHFLEDASDDLAEPILVRFRSLHKHYHCDDVLLVDDKENIRLSVSGISGRLTPDAARLTAQALQKGCPLLSDLHTMRDEQMPHIDAVAPFYSLDGKRRPVGAVIMKMGAGQFLYPLIQSWPRPSQSAETLLVRREGDDVLFLNELRHRGNTALRLRIPLHQKDVPAVMTVLGQQGVAQGIDYRGVEVLSVLKPVPESPWFMVAKIDMAEAFAGWRFRAVLILALLFVLVTVVAVIAVAMWQRRKKIYYRQLFRAEAEQRKSEERYRTILLSVGDGVIVTDAAGRLELLNPVASALTGWSLEEAVGKPIEEVFAIVNEESRQQVGNPVRRVISEGIVVGLANHTVLIARDGSERPIADSGAPIRDAHGEFWGTVLVFRDQTHERAAQHALHGSEDRFRRLFDLSPIGAAMVGLDQRFIRCNQALCDFLGYSHEEMAGKTIGEVTYPDDLHLGLSDINDLITGKRQLVQAEKRYLRKDGQTVWGQVTVHLQRDRAGKPAFFFPIIQDIDERKRQEQEKEKLQAQLLQAQKMEAVGRLAGGVAHDFNNMLQAILGYGELALMQITEGSPLRESMLEIRKAAKRSADLTRQLLAFARKQTINPKVIDLNDTVAGMLKMLRRLIGEDVDMTLVGGHDLWKVKLDPSQVDQILANLVVNARDAIAGVGKITIETANATIDDSYCATHAGATAGQYVMLAVSDNGAGMTREVISHLFEPFFTTKGVGKGTGLGLATVYGIVKQNEGFINVYSEPGKGSTFKIYLPRFRDEAEAIETTAEAIAPQGGHETVLMVEDEGAILKLGKSMLEYLGYTVLTANSPQQALDLVSEYRGHIDLVITDVVMPQMNGRELSERLRSQMPGIKCLYMSGYTSNVIAHSCILESGVFFMSKPFSLNTLAAKVREVLCH